LKIGGSREFILYSPKCFSNCCQIRPNFFLSRSHFVPQILVVINVRYWHLPFIDVFTRDINKRLRTPLGVHSQNTCDITTLETYYLNFIASQLYIRKSGCSVLREYNHARLTTLCFGSFKDNKKQIEE